MGFARWCLVLPGWPSSSSTPLVAISVSRYMKSHANLLDIETTVICIRGKKPVKKPGKWTGGPKLYQR